MAENPVEAGAPKTKDSKKRTYEADAIRVMWDPTRCIHTGICLRRLPTVFDVQARPWVDLRNADPNDVADTIRACPTGALRYAGSATVPDEVPDNPTTIEARPNGPLYVRGRLRFDVRGASAEVEETRVALCRCGASANKPFCDNSHREIDFRA